MRILERNGFEVSRQKGSHIIFKHGRHGNSVDYDLCKAAR